MANAAHATGDGGPERLRARRPTADSWLSGERRTEILTQRSAVIDHYRGYKHAFTHSLALPTDEEMLSPSWVTVRPDDGGGYGFSFGPKTAQCGYRKDTNGIGCYFCGLEAGSSIDRVATPGELVEQARRAYSAARKLLGSLPITRVDVQGDGSYFDTRSFDRDGRIALLREVASWPGIKKVMLETRFELITQEILVEILDILGDHQTLVLAGGVESADPFVSAFCVNKGLTNATIERTFKMISELNNAFFERIELNGYIMVKPAFLSEHESIIDAVKTIQQLLCLSKKYEVRTAAKLEPSAISEGTLQGLMHEKGLYSSLSYWAVLEILIRGQDFTIPGSKVVVGGREDMDKFKDIAGNHTSDGCLDPTDAAVYYAVQEYNGHLSIDRVLKTICAAFRENFKPLLSSIENWAETKLDGEESRALAAIKQLIASKEHQGVLGEEEEQLVSGLCRVSADLVENSRSFPVKIVEGSGQSDFPDATVVALSIESRLKALGLTNAVVHVRSVQNLPNCNLVQIATVVQTDNRVAPLWLMLPSAVSQGAEMVE